MTNDKTFSDIRATTIHHLSLSTHFGEMLATKLSLIREQTGGSYTRPHWRFLEQNQYFFLSGEASAGDEPDSIRVSSHIG